MTDEPSREVGDPGPTSVDPVLVNPPTGSVPTRGGRVRRRPTWRGETPTEEMPMLDVLRRTPYRDPRVTRAAAEEREAREAMGLALRVGEVMLRCGAGAPQVEGAVVAVAMAGGLDNLDVDITLQSLLMQSTTGSGQLITLLRVVRSPKQDFARLTAVHSLVDDLVSGELDVPTAARRLRVIKRAPRVWSSWVVALASGLLSAGVAITLGAGWVAVVACILSGVCVERLIRVMTRRELPDFYQSAVGGFLATVFAWITYALGALPWLPVSPADFAYIVAGGIVALLPSRTLASAMEDVITGYSVTGTSRIFAVLFHMFGLIIGVAVGLSLTARLGREISLGRDQPPIEEMAVAAAPVPSILLGAALIGVAGAVTLQARRRHLLPVGLLCVVGVVVTLITAQELGLGRVTSVGVAAVLVGLVGRLIAVRNDAPGIVLIVPATFGLLPGLLIFVGLYAIIVRTGTAAATNQTIQNGVTDLATALGVLMAIATGSILGELLATPFDHSVSERRRMVRGHHRNVKRRLTGQ